jgi:hypothetical protein
MPVHLLAALLLSAGVQPLSPDQNANTEVAIEVRVVNLSDNAVGPIASSFHLSQRAGLNCNGGVPAPTHHVLGFLNDAQLFLFVESAQADRRASVMAAPKLRMADNQDGSVNITDQQFYVTKLQVTQADNGQVVFVPCNEPYSTGLKMHVVPKVSADRRFVCLGFDAELTELATVPVPLIPVTTLITPHFEGGRTGEPVPFTQYIQQPKFDTRAVKVKVCVPDGGTVVLDGGKRTRQVERESCCPLSKIPYVSELFGFGEGAPETERVLFMVTPRIVVSKEDETHAAVAPPQSDVTCPYLKAQEAPRPIPPAPAAPCRTVVDNIGKLEQARKLYEQAEFYRRTGKNGAAVAYYDRVRELCPGSRYDRMARARLAEVGPRHTGQSEVVGVEARIVPEAIPAPRQKTRLAELVKQYHQACAAGRLADATQFAVQALAIDPTCFSKVDRASDHGTSKATYECPLLPQPVPTAPERVYGGIR